MKLNVSEPTDEASKS